MITVRRSANLAIGPKNSGRVGTEPSPGQSKFGTTSGKPKKEGFVSESNTNLPGMGPNSSVSNNPISIDLDPMLTGITPQIEQAYFYRLYRDIYYQDPVAGSAVDMISSLPFSEFSLGGISDQRALTTFMETIERLNLRTMLPEMCVDYLVLGQHVSSLLFNREKRVFTDIMPHAIENLTIESLPFYSQDPIITAKFPDSIRNVMSKDSKRVQRLKKYIGQSVIDKISSGELELDPLSTLYIPRKTFSHTDLGTSYYRRILPIYLIEKNLFRGTLIESARRQRGIMHITLGDGDQWEPSVADLEFITELFMNADSDPLGAIIATRLGVATEELRQGGDFWKSTDFADSVLAHKTRALGISEGLLSGDANYATADTSLTVFIEMLRSFREMFTRKLFYNKMFPLISMLNGYTVTSKGKLSIKENLLDTMEPEEALYRMNDGSKLLIPTISWAKQLKPEGDSAYLDMLNSMTEKGVPVPLRVLAAAGGLNIEELLRSQDDDLESRKKIAEYVKKIEALSPKPAEGDDGTAEASAIVLASADPTGRTRSAVHASGGKISLSQRNFGSASEVTGLSKTGKVRYIANQSLANERINKTIAKALKNADARGSFRRTTISLKDK